VNAHANHLAVSPDRRKLDEAVERERHLRGFDPDRNWWPIGASVSVARASGVQLEELARAPLFRAS
jgi:hypothetical protein